MQMGLKVMDSDEAFYFLHKDGFLKGAVLIHVDDFNLARNEKFVDDILEVVDQQLTVSKVEKNKFRFTGLDNTIVEDEIKIVMDDYMNSLKEIHEIRKVDRDEDSTKLELKEYQLMTEKNKLVSKQYTS